MVIFYHLSENQNVFIKKCVIIHILHTVRYAVYNDPIAELLFFFSLKSATKYKFNVHGKQGKGNGKYFRHWLNYEILHQSINHLNGRENLHQIEFKHMKFDNSKYEEYKTNFLVNLYKSNQKKKNKYMK